MTRTFWWGGEGRSQTRVPSRRKQEQAAGLAPPWEKICYGRQRRGAAAGGGAEPRESENTEAVTTRQYTDVSDPQRARRGDSEGEN